ncbi:MAG: hypothetical protein ACT4O1_16230 [Gemmatimonadota bacterium]
MTPVQLRCGMIRASVTGVLMLLPAAAAFAQLPSASTRALGMGDNYTALARGYAAVSWNPALLGLPGNPGASLALLPVRGIAGLDPITLKDLKDFEGQVVPAEVREQWLQRIEQEESEQGTGGGDATYVAAQIGNLGVQVGSTFRAIGNLSPGAAELLFFGNAGRTGEPRDFTLTGSDISAHAVSTVAVSYGLSLGSSATRTTAIGLTAKYTVGHLFLFGEDQGSTVTDDPQLNVRFPVVSTSTEDFDANGGAGFGLDVGFATRTGAMTIGVAVRNVINTFEWDESKLKFRPGLARFDQNEMESNFEEEDFANAPADLKAIVADSKFKPVIAAGVAYEASRRLTLSGDVRTRAGDTTLEDGPKLHLGAGAEFRPISVLPIRVGGAIVTAGFQLGGGIGLNLGPLNIAASLVQRKTDLGTDTISMFTLISTTGR